MNASEARKTVADIAADLVSRHGDIDTGRLVRWAGAYRWWREACEALTLAERNDAIFDGRRDFLDSLADAHEDSRFADDGEAAFGREDA